MIKWKIGALILILLGLTGCNGPVPPPSVPTMEFIEESRGWVQVRVSGVASLDYRLHWGDGGLPVTVFPDQELYEHFYQEPGQYTIRLKHVNDVIVGQTMAYVRVSDCHISLVALEGGTITIRYFGRAGVDYIISWGDGHGVPLTIPPLGTGLLTHTYDAPGTFAIKMGEVWAPPRVFLTVTIE